VSTLQTHSEKHTLGEEEPSLPLKAHLRRKRTFPYFKVSFKRNKGPMSL